MRSNLGPRILPFVAATLIAGCSSTNTITGPFDFGDYVAYVICSDFTTGSLSVVDVGTRRVATNVEPVHSDATVRVYDGLIYVINRFGQDNIQVIDPAKLFTRLQFSTGNGSNPQDIAFVSPVKAYISRYGSTDLLIVNPHTGKPLGTISLAAFADADGLPEMAHMALVGPWLFVACQRLTNFAAVNPSVVAVIDTRTDQVADLDPVTPGIQGITLAGRNPFTDFVVVPGSQELLIGCVGEYGVADGGIERIDPVTRQSLGYAITEAAIGGDVLDVAWAGSTHSYAIVNGASTTTLLMSWNPATGAPIDTVFAPAGFSLTDCEINALGELYVCDSRITAPGVRVYRTGADTLLAGPLDTGLPPVRIAFSR